MRVTAAEVRPGLAVHLETAIVRARGCASTNAELRDGHDRAVEGPHYFLITAVDRTDSLCTAVPLFTEEALGSERLDNRKKSGSLTQWMRQDSHFSRWQHWKIPLSSIEAASGDEFTDSSDRCYYAEGDSATLDAINSWIQRNRAAFRDI